MHHLLQDSVSYAITEDTTNFNGNTGSNSLDFFFINPSSGDIYVRRSLTEAPLVSYSVC